MHLIWFIAFFLSVFDKCHLSSETVDEEGEIVEAIVAYTPPMGTW